MDEMRTMELASGYNWIPPVPAKPIISGISEAQYFYFYVLTMAFSGKPITVSLSFPKFKICQLTVFFFIYFSECDPRVIYILGSYLQLVFPCYCAFSFRLTLLYLVGFDEQVTNSSY